jgi:hypothetical protein
MQSDPCSHSAAPCQRIKPDAGSDGVATTPAEPRENIHQPSLRCLSPLQYQSSGCRAGSGRPPRHTDLQRVDARGFAGQAPIDARDLAIQRCQGRAAWPLPRPVVGFSTVFLSADRELPGCDRVALLADRGLQRGQRRTSALVCGACPNSAKLGCHALAAPLRPGTGKPNARWPRQSLSCWGSSKS